MIGSAFTAVCSARPRPSVQSSHAKGSQWWVRDVYHLRGAPGRTMCGRDCSEWLTIGEMETLTDDCCTRCAKMAGQD